MGDFNPYLDYSKITDEMATDVCGALREIDAARTQAILFPSPAAVERVMKSQEAIEDIIGAIQQSIWTIPVLVHEAGPIEDEDHEQFGTVKFQRCVRCKSQLAGWRPGLIAVQQDGSTHEMTPEEMTWHEEGEIIAKAGTGQPLVYSINRGRDLEPHERECVGLPNMGEEA